MTTPRFDGPQVPASASFQNSFAPQTVALGNGGFAVVWRGFLSAADDPDQGLTILARVFNAARTPAGDVFTVPQDPVGQQSEFFAAATSDGGFAVGYFRSYAFGERPGEAEIGLARFDADGARQGDDGIINGDYDQDFVPAPGRVGVEGGADGSVAVLYVDWNSTGITQEEFNGGAPRVAAHVASIFDADNEVTLDRAIIAEGASSVGGQDLLSKLDDGRFAFVEVGTGARIGTRFSTDVDIHVFDAAGAAETTVVFDDSLDFLRGDNAGTVLSDGRVVIVTIETDGDTGRRTPTLTLYDADGSEEVAVALPEQGTSLSSSMIVENPSGGFYFLFSGGDFNGPEKSDVYGFRFDAAGAQVGERFAISRSLLGEQPRPDGAVIANGELVVAFNDTPITFGRTTAEVQALDPAGDTAGAAPTDITLTADPVVPGEPGGIIGTLSTTDADPGDMHAYEVVGGSPIFELDGDVLRFPERFTPLDNASFNQVTIRVTDSQFNSFDKLIEIPFEDTGDGGDGGGNGGGDGGGNAVAPVIWRGNGRNNTKNGAAGDDVLNGRGGKDRLDGKGGDDKLLGGAGNDRLTGGGGKDELNGGGGNDRILGGGGADEIIGGKGRDVLAGGAGRDAFVFGRNDGRDRVVDFQVNRDDLEITSGAKRFKQLEISQKGDDLHIVFGRTKVILEDVDRSDFDKGDVAFV